MARRMMRFYGALIFFLCAFAAFSVPQVAVINAVLAKGIDPTVAAPITDKIIEEMIRSGKFIVIDRTNVEQILKEKEFQLSSGVVRNEEMRQAGEYLGADFVVVANITRVGSTYVISSKMINVISGEIAVQFSAEKEGKIDVLLEVAREVGRGLATEVRGEVAVEEKAEVKQETAAEKEPTDTAPMLELQTLIKKRAFLKPLGRTQMLNLADELPEKQRLLLYSNHTRDDAVMGLLLNLLLVSLGSWIQTDYSGALWELTLVLTGASLFAIAPGEATLVTGAGIYLAGVIYSCIRPFTWVRLWNKNLSTALSVQVALLDSEQGFVAFIPPVEGSSWRLKMNLVSMRY